MQLPSFKVEPEYLSPEHARHVERFTGYPYDAEVNAKMSGYAAFKRWHHLLQVARERMRLISTLRAILQAKGPSRAQPRA